MNDVYGCGTYAADVVLRACGERPCSPTKNIPFPIFDSTYHPTPELVHFHRLMALPACLYSGIVKSTCYIMFGIYQRDSFLALRVMLCLKEALGWLMTIWDERHGMYKVEKSLFYQGRPEFFHHNPNMTEASNLVSVERLETLYQETHLYSLALVVFAANVHVDTLLSAAEHLSLDQKKKWVMSHTEPLAVARWKFACFHTSDVEDLVSSSDVDLAKLMPLMSSDHWEYVLNPVHQVRHFFVDYFCNENSKQEKAELFSQMPFLAQAMLIESFKALRVHYLTLVTDSKIPSLELGNMSHTEFVEFLHHPSRKICKIDQYQMNKLVRYFNAEDIRTLPSDVINGWYARSIKLPIAFLKSISRETVQELDFSLFSQEELMALFAVEMNIAASLGFDKARTQFSHRATFEQIQKNLSYLPSKLLLLLPNEWVRQLKFSKNSGGESLTDDQFIHLFHNEYMADKGLKIKNLPDVRIANMDRIRSGFIQRFTLEQVKEYLVDLPPDIFKYLPNEYVQELDLSYLTDINLQNLLDEHLPPKASERARQRFKERITLGQFQAILPHLPLTLWKLIPNEWVALIDFNKINEEQLKALFGFELSLQHDKSVRREVAKRISIDQLRSCVSLLDSSIINLLPAATDYSEEELNVANYFKEICPHFSPTQVQEWVLLHCKEMNKRNLPINPIEWFSNMVSIYEKMNPQQEYVFQHRSELKERLELLSQFQSEAMGSLPPIIQKEKKKMRWNEEALENRTYFDKLDGPTDEFLTEEEVILPPKTIDMSTPGFILEIPPQVREKVDKLFAKSH